MWCGSRTVASSACIAACTCLSGRRESSHHKIPQDQGGPELFLESFPGQSPSMGWMLSSWSHLSLLEAISLKEQVILAVTVIKTDTAQLCLPDEFTFPSCEQSLLSVGSCKQHVPQSCRKLASSVGQAWRQGRHGCSLWDPGAQCPAS